MVSALITTSWGHSASEPMAPHALIDAASTWEIYKRADGNFVAFALQGARTRRSLKSTEQLARDYVAAVADPGAPVTPPPAPPPAAGLGELAVSSVPTGANIFIDGTDTRFSTPHVFNTEQGTYNVRITKTGFEDGEERNVRVTAGQRTAVVPPLTTIAPPIPPPTPTPPEPGQEPEFRTGLSELVIALGGEPPEILRAWDGLINWLTQTFGTEFPTVYQDEITGELKRAPTGKKILMFIAMPAPVSAAEGAIQSSIASMTASEIQAEGLKNPKGLLNLFKALPSEKVAELFGRLSQTANGRAAVGVIQRIVLDSRIVIPTWAKISAVVGAAIGVYQISHTLNFLGFLGEEAIQTAGIGVFTLIANKNWAEAAKSLPVFRDTANAIIAQVDELARVPALSFWLNQWWPGTKAAVKQQLDDYDAQIKDGLEAEEVGSIGVETNPTNASVWVNDVLYNWKSNTVIDDLVPGKYQIRVELAGHVTHEEQVTVAVKEQTLFTHEFELIDPDVVPRGGRYQWESKDAKTGAVIGVSWYHNGTLQKSFTTSGALDVIPDTYELRFTAIGYEDFEDTILVEEGKTNMLIIEMTKLPPPVEPPVEPPEPPGPPEPTPPEKGHLEVNSNVQASILIGGQEQAKKTPATFDLTQGIYSVTLKADGYVTRSTTTLVKAGEQTNVFLELRAVDAPPATRLLARVSIQSEPSSAKILVNGVFTKKYTPDSVLLEAGDYEISLSKSGYKTWSTPLRLVEES